MRETHREYGRQTDRARESERTRNRENRSERDRDMEILAQSQMLRERPEIGRAKKIE